MAVARDLRDAGFDERQAATIEKVIARPPDAKEGTPIWVALPLLAIVSAILARKAVELRDVREAVRQNRERLAVPETNQQQVIATQQQILQILRSR